MSEVSTLLKLKLAYSKIRLILEDMDEYGVLRCVHELLV